MRRAVWFVVFVGSFALVACGPGLRPELPDPSVEGPARLRVKTLERGVERVREIPVEEYVAATLLSEWAPGGANAELADRMLEVQAIISRTYALSHRGRHRREGFDLCATTHCQVYDPVLLRSSRWSAASSAATRRTQAVVLSHQGELAEALFHADCGGHTSDAADVWGGTPRPYLRAVPDALGSRAHVEWEFRATRQAVLQALNAEARTRVGSRLHTIAVVRRDRAGRAERVAIRGEFELEVRGEDLRAVLTRTFGARSIKSTWFEVSSDSAGYRFCGRGFGHGVGLCQSGALVRLQRGAKPADVLRHYYPAVTLVRARLRP